MDKKSETKYFMYCRKSSEDSTRQVASIGDQIDALMKIVSAEGLALADEPFQEERSSKDPGRPLFNEMLNRVEHGEANGILCWDVDRLYRNPVDEGRMRWLLQKGTIRVIRTPNRSFYPDDAGLLMGVEGGRATDYVIRLSKNVKRGLEGRVRKGWMPGALPIGYLRTGDNTDRVIVRDPERFDLVRRMWDMFLSGERSVSEIHKIASKEFGLRTRAKRRIGGKPLSISAVYRMFNDPFYYGVFYWSDYAVGEKIIHKGNHEPMITEKEFERGQVLLGRKGKHRPQKRSFAFTGLMRCGECQSVVTAEVKNQIICTFCKHKFSYENKTSCSKCLRDISEMTNPTILSYTYYRCAKKRGQCSQKTIRVEELEKQIDAELERSRINPDYLAVAVEYLQAKQAERGQDAESIKQALQASVNDCDIRLNKLIKEYASPQNLSHEIYTPEEYSEMKLEIKNERATYHSELTKVLKKIDDTQDVTERIFNFCTFARKTFNETDDLHKKREILITIGSNLELKDRKLIIHKPHPYILIENELRDQMDLYESLEPTNGGSIKEKEAVLTASIPSLRRVRDSNPRGLLDPGTLAVCWF